MTTLTPPRGGGPSHWQPRYLVRPKGSVGPCRIAGGGDGGSTVLRSGGEGGAAALGAPNGWLVRGTRVRGKSQSERGIKNGEGRGGQVLSVQAGVSLTGC